MLCTPDLRNHSSIEDRTIRSDWIKSAILSSSRDLPDFDSGSSPPVYLPPTSAAETLSDLRTSTGSPPPPFSPYGSSPAYQSVDDKPSCAQASSSRQLLTPTTASDVPFEPLHSLVELELKAAVTEKVKAASSSSKTASEEEPPPPYEEDCNSPISSFVYSAMASGAASSIITQVSQGSIGPPLNTLDSVSGDENVNLDLRGTHFTLSRDELLTLPEFVLLSLFPNGLLPGNDSHLGPFGHDPSDWYPVDYDPASLHYMLEFFRQVAQTIPTEPQSDSSSSAEQFQPNPADPLQDRAGIIVLREDLDFYVIPPKAEIQQAGMLELKRNVGRSLTRQDGIFSGLRRSEEMGTTEQHLIEMLTAG